MTFVHNWWPNATTKHSPHELLLGYCPSAAEEPTGITNNKTVEARHQIIKQHREATLYALDKAAQTTPESQHNVGDWVWLKAKYLALPYTSAKLAPRHHSPFQIMKEISLVAYQLTLPRAWTIHNIFHSSLLTPYKEMLEHGAQFQCPPPKLIGNEEEYEVEQIINHWHHGKHHQLQYLICWKGYSAADDTWEPADQVHANKLVKSYHMKHVKDGMRHKNQRQIKIKTTIRSLSTCCQPTLPTSPLPLLQASLLTWTPPNHSLSGPQPKLQWFTDRSCSQFPLPSWPFPQSSVSCNSPLIQYALLSKDIGHPGERNSSSLHKDWQELCEKNQEVGHDYQKQLEVLKQQGEELAKCEAHVAHLEATYKHWKANTDRRDTDWEREVQGPEGYEENEGSLPPTSKWTDCTAWAPLASMSPSTDMSSFPLSISPSTKRGSSPTGSSKDWPMTLHTLPCTITQEPRRTGESQLSSSGTMTCMLKLPPWLQSKGVWPLLLRLPKSSWTRASDICSAPMHTSSTNSSAPSMRDPTLTPNPRGGSPPSLGACAMVHLDLNWRVMSQGSLQEGKRTAGVGRWAWLTPKTGRAVWAWGW